MALRLFIQPCKTCGTANQAMRDGDRADGGWLGHDDCLKCRVAHLHEERMDCYQFGTVPSACTLDVGCDEAGVCYADAHGEPERCPKIVEQSA